MKNRRGDVPITILVIGVVMVCALALISFFSSSFKLEQSFTGVSVIDDFKVKIDEYNFYNTLGVELPEGEFDIRPEKTEGKPEREYLFMQEGNIEVRFYLP